MNDSSYPSLFRNADSASLKAQSAYLRLHKIYLGSLIMGSAIGASTTLGMCGINASLYATMAVVLMVGLFFLWVMRARQDDKVWFDGRAVAESVKTATWRFIMKVPPFHEENEAEMRFLSQLKEIRKARPQLGKHIAAVSDTNSLSITDFMREKRSAQLEDRRAFYLSDRLVDQKSWYLREAKVNTTSSARWFWIVACIQIIAVILAIIQAVSGNLNINVVPVITTCAAAFAAWGQMKRYDELAQSYALAAQELEELESLASSQTTSEDFAQLIEQAENSISREHIMWCARRDVRLLGSSGR